MDLLQIATKAKKASYEMMNLGSDEKNRILLAMGDALVEHEAEIIEANRQDIREAERNGMPRAMLDRLMLNSARIGQMADGLAQVSLLQDPIGSADEVIKRPNGLQIIKRCVPLGVVGIIYEARPNVTADVVGICIKSGNAVLLRGGSEALQSNLAIYKVLIKAGEKAGLPNGAIGMLEDPSREVAEEMMRLNGLIDVLIPRGGAGLIRSVVENSTVPVIETGIGNCHVYVDRFADLSVAERIVINAKCSRPAVCNAAETVLLARKIAEPFLIRIAPILRAKGVEVRADEETLKYIPWGSAVSEEDWATEYNDLVLAIKVIDGVDEAIDHINRYGTKHSEAIITEHYSNAQRFLDQIDAAAVYVNASTRFTDGGEFGFGAEMGISTQKLHARGPLGLREMTTYKYVIYGSGQVR